MTTKKAVKRPAKRAAARRGVPSGNFRTVEGGPPPRVSTSIYAAALEQAMLLGGKGGVVLDTGNPRAARQSLYKTFARFKEIGTVGADDRIRTIADDHSVTLWVMA